MEPRFKMSYKVTEDNFRELQRYFMFQRSVKMILNLLALKEVVAPKTACLCGF